VGRPGGGPALRRRTGLFLCELALYVLLAVVSFFPQVARPADTVAYVGDSLSTTYGIAWSARQVYGDPLRLYDANTLHPVPRAGTLVPHRILLGAVLAPVLWTTGNAVLAYNLGVLAVCLFTALAGRRLARALGLSPLAAWTAGALYAFHTYQVNEAPRLDLLLHAFMFLALASLVRYLRDGRVRDAWATAGLMLLQGLGSNYLLLYGTLLLSLVLGGVALARPRLFAARAGGLLLPALAAAMLFLPVLVPLARSAGEYEMAREAPTGIDLRHYLATAPGNLLYGQIGGEVRLQQRAAHFVGFFAVALAALAVARARRGPEPERPLLPARVWVPAAAALAGLFVLLSLGRDLQAFGWPLGPGPYRALHAWVPGFRYVRIPERFALLALFFVALLAARGLHLVQAAGWRRLSLLLAALVPLEHLSLLPQHVRVPAGRELPAVYSWLRQNDVRAVAEVPIHGEALVRKETLEEYFSTAHFRPIVHGYVSYPPLITRLLRRLAAEFPSEATLQAFRRAGVDTVVVHHGRPVGLDLAEKLRWADARTRDEAGPRLMREARLDLFARLPEAVAAGQVARLARFEGASGRVYEGTADEVYRIAPGAPTIVPAPQPRGRRLRDPAWTYRAKLGAAALAADGLMDTAWVVARPLRGDEFWEVTFDRPRAVAGVVLPLSRTSVFPTRFRLGGRDAAAGWTEIARFDDAHALQLLEQLLRSPRGARVGFDLGGRTWSGISLLVSETGTSYDGWLLPEIEVWVP
jgi:hypothetical protein